MGHKQLERCRDFLVYVDQAYSSLVPQLKGIHLTIYIWRAGRNKDGWKRSRSDMEQLRRRGDPEGMLEAPSEDAPPLVISVTSLEQYLKALM
jgi:hypothetical protein